MARVTVDLTAVMNDGKTIRQPGESVSMDEARAQKLAALGMALLPKKAAPANARKGKAAAENSGTPDLDGNGPDTDDEGDDNV